jgi:hypothetical protein
VSALRGGIAFVYDFLADDGWELLAGLVLLLPLVFFVGRISPAAAGLALVLGLLATLTVTLTRQLPRRFGPRE